MAIRVQGPKSRQNAPPDQSGRAFHPLDAVNSSAYLAKLARCQTSFCDLYERDLLNCPCAEAFKALPVLLFRQAGHLALAVVGT